MDTSDTYAGKGRVLDRNGMLLDVGKADLRVTDLGGWKGTLSVFRGSCLESKSLTVLIEVEDGTRALAQVGPKVADLESDLVQVKVVGIESAPF